MPREKRNTRPSYPTSFILGEKTKQQILQLIEWDQEDRAAGTSPLIVTPTMSEIVRAAVNLLWMQEYARRPSAIQRRKRGKTSGKKADEA